MTPVKIKVREKEFLDITWNDGVNESIKLSNLRNLCPCAVCNAEKEECGDSYIPLYTKEQLTITKMKIVGNYALSIEWEDGHNTGLYDFTYLKSLFENFPAEKMK